MTGDSISPDLSIIKPDEYINPNIAECDAFKLIRKDIEMDYERGLIKDSNIKKFLAKYYNGSPHDMLKGNNKKALLEDYILIHEAFVGDDLKEHGFSILYTRHGKQHCCGNLVVKLPNGNLFCEICGTEH